MNPQTGTFIMMDTYQGMTNDPITLHKYLYANANPVMNIDPTGNFSLMDTELAQSISNTIDKAQLQFIKFYNNIFNHIVNNLETYKSLGKAMVNGIVTGASYESSGKRFLSGFVNGFVSGLISYSVGGVIDSGFQNSIKELSPTRYVWITVCAIVGSALGTLVESAIFEKEKDYSEIAKDAGKSAAMGIISGITSTYWTSAVTMANMANSAAKTLMIYSEKDGEILQLFFEQLVNSLVAVIG